MKLKQQEYLGRAEDTLKYAESAIEEIGAGATSGFDLKRKWREFLSNWHDSYCFLRKALQPGKTQSFAKALIDDLSRDLVLQYLYQARNSETHTAKAAEGHDSVFRYGISNEGVALVRISGDANNVILQGNTLVENGIARALPDVNVNISRGVFGGPVPESPDVEWRNPHLELLPALNRGQEYQVPFQDLPPEERPFSTATYGLNYLRRKLAEAKRELLDE